MVFYLWYVDFCNLMPLLSPRVCISFCCLLDSYLQLSEVIKDPLSGWLDNSFLRHSIETLKYVEIS